MNKPIDMTETKIKLAKLAEHMPDCEEVTCRLVAGLVPRLNYRLFPAGMVMQFQLYLHDLRNRTPGVSPDLLGYPGVVYDIFEVEFPDILRATMPAEDAEAVIAAIP